jgi:hypothetical protein
MSKSETTTNMSVRETVFMVTVASVMLVVFYAFVYLLFSLE